MGKLVYGTGGAGHPFPDRTLAHLQAAIGVRLGRGERFYLSWRSGRDLGGGHQVLWISPRAPLMFRYQRAQPIPLSRAWLALLTADHGPDGMVLVDEPMGGESR